MTSEFHMVSLARRGLQAALDEAEAEERFAVRFKNYDEAGELTPASIEAIATGAKAVRVAAETLARFNAIHPEPVAA